MTDAYTLTLNDPRATLEIAGGKGASLARMSAARLPVPDGFHVTTAAYDAFVAENNLQPRILENLGGADVSKPATLEAAERSIAALFALGHISPSIAGSIAQAYTVLPGQTPTVAVRSSATAEDLPGLSFAGQQETYLNIHGVENVLDAVQRCWASLWTARAIGYRLQHGIDQTKVSLAVVVQLLVPAEASGVMFTANPLNGHHDQTMITATWGLGEAIVGGLVTPDTLIVDKASGKVQDRQTADKQVFTVRVDGGTQEQPTPEALRDAPVLSDTQAADLARLGDQIEALFERPMDVEWTLLDGTFAIVQARPITALPEPAQEAPRALTAEELWSLPNPKGRYMRASICELLPEPASPLFETLAFDSLQRGIDKALCLFDMPPNSVPMNFICSINGYTYQSVNFSAREWWNMIKGMFPKVPRMLREGISIWQNVALPAYAAATARWRDKLPENLAPSELLAGVNEIMDKWGVHLGSLMASTMGPSAGSEGIFTQVYNKYARQDGDPEAPALLLGFDSKPILGEKALYDLAQWCREQPALAEYLRDTQSTQIATALKNEKPEQPPSGLQPEIWQEWRKRFVEHLEHYGYVIYDMDFSHSLPVDDPSPMLETLKMFMEGKGKNPYERQEAFVERRAEVIQAIRTRLRGLKRWAFEKSLNWAQSQTPMRENGIAEIGLGYPVVRTLLHELGHRCVSAGMFADASDIYYLKKADLEQAVAALESREEPVDYRRIIQQRKEHRDFYKKFAPPPQLPLSASKKYMGFNLEVFLPGAGLDQTSDTIKGIGSSPGSVTGVARVLLGPQDFDQMRLGDVLVAPITTPAWTPLFAMASAVVTDIGGPLSHSSIVAREYGIPAVLGTHIATRRIHNGQTITVDGGAGTVILGSAR
jgi:phosphoenolpyruvate synthase/pyruvate phosphate dikinase